MLAKSLMVDTSPEVRKTPHLTEDGRALPIVGEASGVLSILAQATFPVLSVSEVESLRAALSDFALDIDGVPVHKKNNSA
jgi:hypothetical protein